MNRDALSGSHLCWVLRISRKLSRDVPGKVMPAVCRLRLRRARRESGVAVKFLGSRKNGALFAADRARVLPFGRGRVLHSAPRFAAEGVVPRVGLSKTQLPFERGRAFRLIFTLGAENIAQPKPRNIGQAIRQFAGCGCAAPGVKRCGREVYREPGNRCALVAADLRSCIRRCAGQQPISTRRIFLQNVPAAIYAGACFCPGFARLHAPRRAAFLRCVRGRRRVFFAVFHIVSRET